MVRYSFIVAALLCLCCSLSSADFFPDYDDNGHERGHERIRRFVRFMSRKSDPDARNEMGIGFKGHLKNLLHGGTFGMEFYVPKSARRFVNHWKEFLEKKRSTDEEKHANDDEEEDEEEVIRGTGVVADDEEGEPEVEKREDNELDYVRFINPRVTKDEP